MTEKQINKWLRRQFSPIGWVLIGYYALMNLLLTVTMAVDMGRQALWNLATGNFWMDFDWDALWNNGWGYIAANLVVLVILFAWKGSGYWQQVLGRKEKKMTASVLFTMVSFCLGAQLLNSFWIGLLEAAANAFDRSFLPALESVSGATDTLSMFLYGSLFAPVAEEVLFRGFTLDVLRPYGKRFAILGSAVLFGLFHGNLLQSPYAFVMGLLFAYLAVEYSFFWALGLHMFNNLVLAEGLSRLCERLPVAVADIGTLLLLGSCFLISLGILTTKRRQIRAYRAGEWIDRRCLKCLFTCSGVLVLFAVMLGNILNSLYV